MGWGPFEFVRRAITLPKAYNSLSDIARNPLGALGNALPYIAIASGMGWVSIPGLPSGFLKGSGLGKLGNVGTWIQKNPAQAALMAAGIYSASRAQQEGQSAERAISSIEDLYRRLFEQSLPFASAFQSARLQLLQEGLAQPDVAIAQARRALDAQLQNIEARQALAGLRSLSTDRQRATALANFASQVAALRNVAPWQRLSMLMGQGMGYDASALGNLAALRAQTASQAAAREQQVLNAFANLLPLILSDL